MGDVALVRRPGARRKRVRAFLNDTERVLAGVAMLFLAAYAWPITVTTVGYGDHFPITVEGRFVACGLMIGGVALIGVVTASFAAWFIDRVRDEDEEVQAATRRDLDQIVARLDVLTKEMTALRKAADRAERCAPTPR